MLLEANELAKFKQLTAKSSTTMSKEIRRFVRAYIKNPQDGGQAALDKFQDHGFGAFPTLGEKNQREKLEKMSDSDVIDILRYSERWANEAAGLLKRRGWRDSDIRRAKSTQNE